MSMEAVITNLHECAGVDEKALKAYVDGLVMVNTTCYVWTRNEFCVIQLSSP